MGVPLHLGGRTRGWIGRRLGGDETLGDRVWRRCLHLGGLVVLAVYVVPADLFGPVPVRYVLDAALAAVLLLELLRILGRVELPTIRPHERRRVASYAYYAIALVLAVELLPEAVAVAAVVGCALVDPLLGELRGHGLARRPAAGLGALVYGGIALAALVALDGPPRAILGVAAVVGAGLAVLVEGPGSWLPVDDDLAMVLVPGVVTALLLAVA